MVDGLQLGSQGQADLCEFKSNLVYKENSRAAKNAQRNLVSTNKLTNSMDSWKDCRNTGSKVKLYSKFLLCFSLPQLQWPKQVTSPCRFAYSWDSPFFEINQPRVTSCPSQAPCLKLWVHLKVCVAGVFSVSCSHLSGSGHGDRGWKWDQAITFRGPPPVAYVYQLDTVSQRLHRLPTGHQVLKIWVHVSHSKHAALTLHKQPNLKASTLYSVGT